MMAPLPSFRRFSVSAEELQREPFRIFFPLAFLLGAAGVSHWVLFSTGVLGRYLSAFHAVTQMQSFMVAFAGGFLLTAIPKRTQTAPATWLEIAGLALLLPVVSLAELFNATAISQIAYLASLLLLLQFAIRRFVGRTAGRRPPPSFVLVPMGFLAGLGGAAMLVLSELTASPAWVHSLGRSLVLEGVFVCLALGIGGFFFRLALRGEAPPDLRPTLRSTAGAAAYLLAGAAVIGGLVLQDQGFVRIGPWLRAAAAAAVLVSAGGLRPPVKPGLNRHLVWAAAWAIPVGLIAAGSFPDHRIAAMHVLYVGGFGLLAFSVSAHVALGHSGYPHHQDGWPWPILAFGALFVIAMGLRITAIAVPAHYFGWLGIAAATWLTGATVWAVYLLPKMWRAPLTASAR